MANGKVELNDAACDELVRRLLEHVTYRQPVEENGCGWFEVDEKATRELIRAGVLWRIELEVEKAKIAMAAAEERGRS